ncbi:hypothetical protein KAJ27_15165 [bacterium]|nr:hypothetical protein [bacterium]
MNKEWELHQCENMPSSGVEVLWSMDEADRRCKTWRLIIRREATEEDVDINYDLEEVGQTLWEIFLEITHCPFCGMKLFDMVDSNFEDFGKFVHYDHSGWDMETE